MSLSEYSAFCLPRWPTWFNRVTQESQEYMSCESLAGLQGSISEKKLPSQREALSSESHRAISINSHLPPSSPALLLPAFSVAAGLSLLAPHHTGISVALHSRAFPHIARVSPLIQTCLLISSKPATFPEYSADLAMCRWRLLAHAAPRVFSPHAPVP